MSKAVAAVRYASRTTGVNFEKILTWAAIAGVAYVAYKAVTLTAAVSDALASVGSAVGSGLYDFFHRDQVGETLFYTVRFPDGVKHSIPSRSVDNAGLFKNTGNGTNYTGDGKLYRIVRQKSDGLLVAIAV